MPPESNEIAKQTVVGLIRGALGAVPYLGTFLTEAVFDTRSRIKLARINRFIELLAEQMRIMPHTDLSNHPSDEFSDLLETILDLVMRTRSESRITLYARITAQNVNSNPTLTVDSEWYVSILSSVNDQELILLAELHKLSERIKDESQVENDRGNIPVQINKTDSTILGLPRDDFLLFFDSLIAKGFVIDDGPGRLGAPYRQFIALTTLGWRLMAFVRNGAVQSP